ncbi:LysR family transcriptional regulator [Nonomuraea sp. PA05]|nr:LysR family transcriptional regulator [Nonomuraea sp. PA05]
MARPYRLQRSPPARLACRSGSRRPGPAGLSGASPDPTPVRYGALGRPSGTPSNSRCRFRRTAAREPRPVSQAIRKQEHEVGATLFERTSRSVRLTPIGERLYAGLRLVHRGLSESMERARLAARGKTEVLRVGMLPGDVPRPAPLLGGVPGPASGVGAADPPQSVHRPVEAAARRRGGRAALLAAGGGGRPRPSTAGAQRSQGGDLQGDQAVDARNRSQADGAQEDAGGRGGDQVDEGVPLEQARGDGAGDGRHHHPARDGAGQVAGKGGGLAGVPRDRTVDRTREQQVLA